MNLFGNGNDDDSSSGRGSSLSGGRGSSLSGGQAEVILTSEAPMSIQYPLVGAWGDQAGIRTPRTSRSANSNRSTTPRPASQGTQGYGDRLVVTPAED
jgi:hypothetical protein